jgi:hypothetical protein
MQQELPPQPYLVVGATDMTEVAVECLASSKYEEPVYQVDPAEELLEKQLLFDSGAAWVKCARENGLPNLKDPDPPKADNNETTPYVLLPGDITEVELRGLLAACPNFDAEATDALMARPEELFGDGDDTPPMKDVLAAVEDLLKQYPLAIPPIITFDIPGASPYGGGGNGSREEPTEADAARAQALEAILHEAETAYYEATANQ